MNATRPALIMQRWNALQYDVLPELRAEVGVVTPKLERVIYVLEWARIEEFADHCWDGIGRPPHVRAWLANAFVAKAVLGITTTVGLVERLVMDKTLRRICGFRPFAKLPSEATFSRAFAQFAEERLVERAYEAMIKEHLGDQLIGHISRDGTAIVARERPAAAANAAPAPRKKGKRKGKRPVKQAPPTAGSPIRRQRGQTLPDMLAELPTICDRGTKCNAQGYKTSWNGYKLHIDTADCGVPIAALLCSASMHDSRAAVPLSHITKQRVTNLYDVMDAAYCSKELHAHCRELGHVPLIDHNARGGEKEHFEPADAVRYRERSVAERTNARLKDEFGGRNIMVKGHAKVMSHLMFGLLALGADQLMRLRRCPDQTA
ncbi:MAG TPA: transposase [Gammaproteobacteria bacterium]|nr:transposase [Gammaproteobacteria bacterium]